MKRTMLAAMAALGLIVLSGCDRAEEDRIAPQTSVEGAGSTGSSTSPGMASESAGNQADQNTTDAVPTQQQLDPATAPSGSGTSTTP